MFQMYGRALCRTSLDMDDTQSTERIIQRGDQYWIVREVNTSTVAGSHGARCLICESDDIVRRVWEYPDDWDKLSDDALLELCAKSVHH